MRRRDLLGGLSLVPLAAPAVAQCVLSGFPRINLPGRCEGAGDLPSLDLSFMSPGTLDPRITFSRASTATYFNSAGVMQTAAVNAPRWDYDPATLQLRGLLIEDARTNLLLNSATLSTQSVAVTATAYTLSFYGTGTIARSGVSTGSLVGTGATQRVAVTFTPTAGSLTCTVTGSVTNAQLEAGSFATSYIPTTGAAATRVLDACTIQPGDMASWMVPPGGTWFMEFIGMDPAPAGSKRIIGRRGVTSQTALFTNVSRFVGQSDSVSVVTANTMTPGAVTKAASAWATGRATVCLNGGAVAASAALVTGYNVLFTDGVYFLVSTTVPADSLYGWARSARYWPRVLSDAEMQALTS